MDTILFDRLCNELGYEPSTVRVIRVTARAVSVTYTEPSGMPAAALIPCGEKWTRRREQPYGRGPW
jgi:hypothetical protein